MRPADLRLSERLQTLADQGELSEGSEAYLVAQKVVREGMEALTDAERGCFESEVAPRLAPDSA